MAINSLRRTTNWFTRAESIVVISLPFLLYLAPTSWLNSGHTFCPFKNIFGINCPGCGITHALISALHLHFKEAFNYNRLIVVVLPLLVYLWGKEVIRLIIN
jgi:hypothetical protein